MVSSRIVMSIVSLVLLAGCTEVIGQRQLERTFKQSFAVSGTSRIEVRVSGGSITVHTAEGRSADVVLTAHTRGLSNSEMEERLANYDVTLDQSGDVITVSAKRKPGLRMREGVGFSADITVPANVRLDLNTSGGSIRADGRRSAPMAVRTSGGSITVEGSSADLELDTSGGSIRVGRVETTLDASTSGGSITVSDVDARATRVELGTSGGSINVAVDPRASLTISGSTSGGGVSVEGLPVVMESMRNRSRVNATLNGGRGRLTARTSGGSITFRSR